MTTCSRSFHKNTLYSLLYELASLTSSKVYSISVPTLKSYIAPQGIYNGNKTSRIEVEGDIMLGGLFPVHEKHSDSVPCGRISESRGVHRVEAMLWAIDKINNDPTMLPGLKLGALILDSCGDPPHALNQSLEFVRAKMGDANALSSWKCADGRKAKRTDATKPVAAVIGASISGVSIQVANLLRLFGIVQISPASTNADLSDKTKYEYFARTVPPDTFQAQAMVDIVAHYQWSYVSLVYSAGEYGELGAEAFKKAAVKQKVCVAKAVKMTGEKDVHTAVEDILTDVKFESTAGARVVVLFLRKVDVSVFLKAMNTQLRKKDINSNAWPIFVASEGWDQRDEETVKGAEQTAKGSIVLALNNEQIKDFDTYYKSLNGDLKNPLFARNAWLEELWQDKYHCSFNVDISSEKSCVGKRVDDTFVQDDKVQFVVAAVYAVAHALQQMFDAECLPRIKQQLFRTDQKIDYETLCAPLFDISGKRARHFYDRYLLTVKFRDHSVTGNKTFSFDASGDAPAYYRIANYWYDNETGESSYTKVGTWNDGELKIDDSLMRWHSSGPIHAGLGQIETDVFNATKYKHGIPPFSNCSAECDKSEKRVYANNEALECCWTCTRCEENEIQNVNRTSCTPCPRGYYPLDNHTDCYLLPLQYMQWNTVYSIVPTVFSILGILCTIFVIFVYVKYNDTPVVKASGRELSYLLLAAIIICYGITFVLLARPGVVSCTLRRLGVGFGFALLYAAMLVKTNRIYRIFHYARMNIQPKWISPFSQVVITCLLTGAQLLGSVIWLLVKPPGTLHDYPEIRGKIVVLKCNVPDAYFLISLIYDGILIVLCTVYAIKARQVPENFNEAKFIGFTMYTTCIVWLAFVPIYFGTGTDFQMQAMTLCISISMSASVPLVLIFSPKLYIIFFEPEKNVRKQDKMMSNRSRSAQRRSTYGDSAPPDSRTNKRDSLDFFENKMATQATPDVASPLLVQSNDQSEKNDQCSKRGGKC